MNRSRLVRLELLSAIVFAMAAVTPSCGGGAQQTERRADVNELRDAPRDPSCRHGRDLKYYYITEFNDQDMSGGWGIKIGLSGKVIGFVEQWCTSCRELNLSTKNQRQSSGNLTIGLSLTWASTAQQFLAAVVTDRWVHGTEVYDVRGW
eukprot:6394947-Pyramimonas_sp.AAC.1